MQYVTFQKSLTCFGWHPPLSLLQKLCDLRWQIMMHLRPKQAQDLVQFGLDARVTLRPGGELQQQQACEMLDAF